jgi:hypothetical protein
MMAGESRESWGPADGLWGDRRPPAFVGDRLWMGDVVSRGGILSSLASAVRFVVTMARMLWSSEGMTEREGASGGPLVVYITPAGGYTGFLLEESHDEKQ